MKSGKLNQQDVQVLIELCESADSQERIRVVKSNLRLLDALTLFEPCKTSNQVYKIIVATFEEVKSEIEESLKKLARYIYQVVKNKRTQQFLSQSQYKKQPAQS